MRLSVGIFFCFILGCGWFHPKPSVSENTESLLSAVPLVESGKILNRERLQKGGSLLVIPFKAGPGVEADGELDRMALTIVKGISDKLKEKNTSLKLLDYEHAQEADFVLQGHITLVEKPSQFNKWVKRDKTIEVSAEGEIIDLETDKKIVIFSDSRKSSQKDATYKDLGYQIGERIGRFLLSGIEN